MAQKSNRWAKRGSLIVPGSVLVRSRTTGKYVDLGDLGIRPGISGGARGFNQVGDVITQTVDGRDLNEIWTEFQASLALHNSERDRLLNIMTFDVNDPIEDVFQGGETVDFEKASEFGVPRGIRTSQPSYFSLGYDFDWFDVGIRYTWMFLSEVKSAQLDSLNNATIEADNRLMFTKIMRAVFNNITRVAEISNANYNVFPLYNGDSTVPPRYKNYNLSAPHTHYLVSGGASVVSGDLNDMEDHLKHHGYTWQNGTMLLLLANSAQTPTIATFRVANGDRYDFVQSQGTPVWAIPPDLLTDPNAAPPTTIRGLPVVGRYGPWLVIEEDLVPAAYLLGLASGGEQAANNLVGLRQHVNTSLRGLRLVKGPDNDYPLVESYYQRGFGTGIRQRGAGVVMQIKASGSYDIPADYV